MPSPEIWSDKYKVHSYHTDRYSKLRINVIAGFLQESAWLHSNACGIGYNDLMQIGKMWILSGIKIKVEVYPSWGDEITMNTWGNDYEDPFAYRDFELLDRNGNQIVSGCTSWLLINISNHRPNRITPEYQKIPRRGIDSGSGKPERLAVLAKYEYVKFREVTNSDIDIYQHVNNAKYVEWFSDLVATELWKTHEIDEITVNYLSESLPDNKIRFSIIQNENSSYYFSAYNETLKKEVCRAEFHFRKKMIH